MTLVGCPREKDVRHLVLRGQWPQAAEADLRAHVAACRACSEVALVMQTFRAARAETAGAASAAPAGVIWWRAQLRRRKAAMEKIEKPILGAQVFALVSTLAIAAAFVLIEVRRGAPWLSLDWLSRFGQLPHAVSDTFAGLWTSASSMPVWGLVLGIAGLAAVAVLSGVMLFVDRQHR